MVRGGGVSNRAGRIRQPRLGQTCAPAKLGKNFFLRILSNEIAKKCWKFCCVQLGFWAFLADFLCQCGDGERHAIQGAPVCGMAREAV